MPSTLAQGAAGVPNYLSGSSPGRLERRVLSEERGKCCSSRPFCGDSRATPRDASHYLNCRRCQPSQSTDPHQPASALGSHAGEPACGCAADATALLASKACRCDQRRAAAVLAGLESAWVYIHMYRGATYRAHTSTAFLDPRAHRYPPPPGRNATRLRASCAPSTPSSARSFLRARRGRPTPTPRRRSSWSSWSSRSSSSSCCCS